MKKLLLILITFLGLAWSGTQVNRTVRGTVYAKSDGLPLTGVSVKVTGTSTGTLTDAKGAYAIILPDSKYELSFSFIGYQTQTVKVGKKDKVDVYLNDSNSFLSEVVVTAGGKIAAATGSNDAATTESLASLRVDQAIQGRLPGVSVTKTRVNGKDYAGNVSPRTNNLPADILEKAQVIDSYGDQTVVQAGKKVMIRGFAQTPQFNMESYAKLIENKYQKPVETPLSTFSVDVDGASYSNIRRFINAGQLPPVDAVRIEEMINYFKYQMPEPKTGEPVAITTQLAAAPWNAHHQLLRIGLKARTIPFGNLPASNLVFLVDVSGSMDELNKLPLVKTSLKMLTEQLRAQDRVAIVVYAGNAGLVLASTPGNEKSKIEAAIDNLSAGGSTAGGEGIRLAYKIARENFHKTSNNRIVLCTDGDFNVGASSDESMEQLITKERDSGIDLSVMGFGMGNYKDSKMETLADKGNGNYAYIDNLTEAHKAFVSEFSGTMFTVAKDVKLQLEFNPATVQAYRLIGYENRLLNKEDFNNDRKDAGDMGSGHTVTALYEIVPAGIKDDYTGSVDPLKYQKPVKAAASGSNEMLTVKFRYKEPQGSVSKLQSIVVGPIAGSFASQQADYRFAAAVAEAGMLLRNSEFKGRSGYEEAIKIAEAAKGADEDGYRSEFVRLMKTAKLITKTELANN